jgi:hypothetical protein
VINRLAGTLGSGIIPKRQAVGFEATSELQRRTCSLRGLCWVSPADEMKFGRLGTKYAFGSPQTRLIRSTFALTTI